MDDQFVFGPDDRTNEPVPWAMDRKSGSMVWALKRMGETRARQQQYPNHEAKMLMTFVETFHTNPQPKAVVIHLFRCFDSLVFKPGLRLTCMYV